MKLIRAEFKNFRLLRDLDLEFSTDSTKRLTVIRAENETGKTTILNGFNGHSMAMMDCPGRAVITAFTLLIGKHQTES